MMFTRLSPVFFFNPISGPPLCFCLCGVLLLLASQALGDDSVLNSKHDLSSQGPGPVRALHESQVCIFCHTPHNASPAAPLWNRSNPQTHYRIYRSSTTEARVDQPGAASKLCLSCHDGSIALGMVLSRETAIPTSHTFIPTGSADLTNDLSDDHPIGFRYDRTLSRRDPELRDPQLVDHRIKLGPQGELECTACHDPHNNELGDFLRLPTRQGVLCTTCHQLEGWRTSAHALSQRSVPQQITHGEPLPFASMSDNACASCHVSHGAPHREQLLRDRAFDLCIGCHDGVTAREVLSSLGQRSGHRPKRVLDRHDANEDPRTMLPHVDCVDCHNPHAVQSNPFASVNPALSALQGPLYKPSMEGVPGVSLAGMPVEEARFYYEVCFRCHADNPVPTHDRIIRQNDNFGNVRRDFLPTAASAHPVTFASRRQGESPSLLPVLRSGATIGCQDCHNNPDARQLGGSGPNGPHGSRYPFLLADRYETADFTTESPASYALCYRCHDRNSILADESFSLHSVHVVRGRSPCSACHTPHGVNGNVAQHSHLINFDLAIVGGARQFVDSGRFSGSCTLTCHGVVHVNFIYGPGAAPRR
jgi:predicted CXXCH cytochrome family protein